MIQVKTILKIIIPLAVLIFIGVALHRSWSQFDTAEIELRWGYYLLATVLSLAAYTMQGVIWNLILRTLGHREAILDSVGVFLLSGLGRYIPSKVFMFLGRVQYYKRHGVTTSQVAIAMWLEVCLAMVGSALMLNLGASIRLFEIAPHWAYISLGVAVVCLFLMHPFTLNLCAKSIGKITKREIPPVTVTHQVLLTLLAVWMVYGAIGGLGFFFLGESVIDLQIRDAPFIIGAFLAAQIVGFLAIFTPGGIGVREGALAALITPILGPPMAITLALLARFFQTINELLIAGGLYLYLRTRRGFRFLT